MKWCVQQIMSMVLAHMCKDFEIQALTEQLLTKYQIFMKCASNKHPPSEKCNAPKGISKRQYGNAGIYIIISDFTLLFYS